MLMLESIAHKSDYKQEYNRSVIQVTKSLILLLIRIFHQMLKKRYWNDFLNSSRETSFLEVNMGQKGDFFFL